MSNKREATFHGATDLRDLAATWAGRPHGPHSGDAVASGLDCVACMGADVLAVRPVAAQDATTELDLKAALRAITKAALGDALPIEPATRDYGLGLADTPPTRDGSSNSGQTLAPPGLVEALRNLYAAHDRNGHWREPGDGTLLRHLRALLDQYADSTGNGSMSQSSGHDTGSPT